MKKNILTIILVFLFVTISYLLYLNINKKNNIIDNNNSTIDNNTIVEEPKETVVLNDLSYNFNDKVYLKDITGIETNETLDTITLGDNTYNFENYEIHYSVVDNVRPMILGGGSSVTVYTGSSEKSVVNKFLCGDNQTSKPDCHIEGKYDLNKVGTYSVKYIAIDESGNEASKDFKLVVKKKPKNSSSSSSSSSSKPGTPIKNYIDKYKNENTLIGIDVSVWQGDINFSKVKKDGVEAALIRLGYGPTSEGKIKLDSKFKANLKGFKEQKIPVGVYFYSYAKTKEDVIKQAEFIVKHLNGTELELPIAFDWENWKSFNNYNVSFKDLNDLYLTFSSELEKHGYKTMLYSSAYYLNKIWDTHNNTWLAYYTSNNDFKKEYMIWQASSRGKVSGISGHVDVNIFYMNKIK